MTLIDRQILSQAVSRFKDANILVVGDIIMDHFIWGSVNRISPEAPVPVVNVTRENLLLGGSANVLNNIYALGGKATLCGVIGSDETGDQLLRLLDGLSSPLDGIIRTADRPTIIKTRIIAQHQQVVRFDREKIGEFNSETLERIIGFIAKHLNEFDAIIVSDYNKGMISQALMDRLRTLLPPERKIPVVVDPKPGRPERFKGVTIITPNNNEAEQMSGIAITDSESLLAAAQKMQAMLDSDAILITRGEAGMALYENHRPMFTIPTVAKEVFDVTGAGDTVIAVLTLGVACGLSLPEASTLANFAAGIVVGKLGTGTASTEELLGAIA